MPPWRATSTPNHSDVRVAQRGHARAVKKLHTRIAATEAGAPSRPLGMIASTTNSAAPKIHPSSASRTPSRDLQRMAWTSIGLPSGVFLNLPSVPTEHTDPVAPTASSREGDLGHDVRVGRGSQERLGTDVAVWLAYQRSCTCSRMWRSYTSR